MKRLIIFIILFFGLVSVANAYTPEGNLVVYTPLTSDGIDLSSNSYNWTNNGATFTGNSTSFDGLNDYLQSPTISNIDYRTETLNFWAKGTASGNIERMWTDDGGTETSAWIDTSNRLRVTIEAGTPTTDTGFSDNTWKMVTVVFRSSGAYDVFINGVNSSQSFNGSGTNTFAWELGRFYLGVQYFSGEMKDFSYFNSTLNQSDITSLYNNGIVFSSTPQIQTNLTSFVNQGTFTSSATTTSNVNMSLYIDGTLNTTICTNCNSSTYNLSLDLGQTIIQLRSENANGINWNNFSVTYNSSHLFRFYDTLRSLYVQDFTFSGATISNEYAILNTSDLLPYKTNNSFTFTKLGYEQEDFNINLSDLNTQLNQTFNVTPVTISIDVFDADTLSPLTFNLSLSNGSNTLTESNIGNYSEFYNNTLTGTVTATINSNGYGESNLFYSVDPLSTTTNNVYLNLINGSTPVIFRALELSQTQAIANATFSFYTKSGNYLGQKRTDSSGFLYFYLDITEDYEIIITKNGYVTQDLKTLPGVTTYTVLMPETGGSASYEFDKFAWSFRPLSNNIASIPFNASITVADELNSLSIFRFNIYDSNGNILFSDSSTSPSGGSFDTTINNVSSFYIYNLSGTRNGVNFEILKTYNFINETNTNTSIKQLAETLNGDENNSERIFIMMIIYIGFMVFGAFFSPGIGAMLGIIPLIIFATVGWLPVGIALLLGIFNGLGGYFFRG